MTTTDPRPTDSQNSPSGSALLRRRLMAFTAMVIAVLVFGTAAWVRTERDEALNIATGTVTSTSRLLASVIDSNFGAIDKVLAGVAESVTARPPAEQDRNPAVLAFLNR